MPRRRAGKEDVHEHARWAALGRCGAQSRERLLQSLVRHLWGSYRRWDHACPAISLPVALLCDDLWVHLARQLVHAQGLIEAFVRHLLHCQCDAVITHPARTACPPS